MRCKRCICWFYGYKINNINSRCKQDTMTVLSIILYAKHVIVLLQQQIIKFVSDLKPNHNLYLSLAITERQRSKKRLVIKNKFMCFVAVDLETHIFFSSIRGVFPRLKYKQNDLQE